VFVGRVEGTVVATVKDEGLRGVKLLLMRVIENGVDKHLVVAADATRQAGPGDFVTWIASKEASLLFRQEYCACDVAITGFIDEFNVEKKEN